MNDMYVLQPQPCTAVRVHTYTYDIASKALMHKHQNHNQKKGPKARSGVHHRAKQSKDGSEKHGTISTAVRKGETKKKVEAAG